MSKSKWDSEENEVQSNWMKWNVPMEDMIFGTLIDKKKIKSTIAGKEGELVWVYEMKADEGSFHSLDDKKKLIAEPTIINPGDFYSIGGKTGIDAQMKNIVKGQKIGLKFIDEVASKTKGWAPAKNVKVYAPKGPDGTPLMDEEYLKEQGQASLEEEFNK